MRMVLTGKVSIEGLPLTLWGYRILVENYGDKSYYVFRKDTVGTSGSRDARVERPKPCK